MSFLDGIKNAVTALGAPSAPPAPSPYAVSEPQPTGIPYSVSSPAVAVTANLTVTLSPPVQQSHGGYSWAIVYNASPWICTVLCATGTVTIMPYSADICTVSGNQILTATTSVGPGGSALAPTGAPTFIVVDWFAAGGAPPSGYFPLALTSQAIGATSFVSISSAQSLLASEGSGSTTVTVTPGANAASLIICCFAGPQSVTVQGATSGVFYPVTASPPFFTVPAYFYVASIVEALDASFNVVISTADGEPWWVLADTALRMLAVYSGAEAQPGGALPSSVVVVAGSDSVHAMALPVVAIGNAAGVTNVLICGGIDLAGGARQFLTNLPGQLLPGAATNPSVGQVAIGNTATAIGTTRTGRTAMTIHNLVASTQIVYIGPSNTVTTATGHAIEPGLSQTVTSQVQWYGIAAAAGATVSFEDE